MTVLSRRQFTVTDQAGNVMAGAWIEVRQELVVGQPLAVLYADRGGATALANPFQADSNGFAFFHVAGGVYRVRAYVGPSGAPTFEQVWDYIAVGTIDELDYDADGTLAANSDGVLPTQKAVKTYVDTRLTTGSATLSNKTLDDTNTITVKDASFTLEDDGNATKQVRFQLSGISALTTRILTVPDANTTLVGTDVAQALTNKTFNAASNTLSNLTTAMFAANVVDTDGTLSANSDTRLASQKATKTYVDQIIAAQDAMVFKGVIDCSANPNYPAADRGWTYRVSVAGKIGGASGTNVENGDILICMSDGTAAGNQATVGSSWVIAQANIDGAVVGPASAVSNNVAVFSGTTGKLIADSTRAAPSGSFVGTTDTQTLTNKTLTGPAITGVSGGLGIRSSGTGAFDLQIQNTENLTANRALTITLGNAARTLSLGGNVTTAAGGDLTISGGSSMTLTNTGTTSVTFPTSGTLLSSASTAAIGNTLLANMAAYTLKGNPTGSAAAPSDFTLGSLTQKASPVAADQVLIADSAASGALKYALVSSLASAGSVSSIAGLAGAFTLSTGLTNSGNDLRMATGTIIGSTVGTYTNNTALSTLVPADDTVPQNNEGTQIISVSYTPRSATSTLKCVFNGQVTAAAADNVIGAIFNGGSASAFAAEMVNVAGVGSKHHMCIEGSYAPGSTAAQTISVRVGGASQTIYLNGNASSHFLGAAAGATLTVYEIQA